MQQRWYLLIDLGTGGIKAAAVATNGRVLASAFRSIDTLFTDDGGAEQDTDQWWAGLVSAVRDLLDDIEHEPDEAAASGPCTGIGITGQWGSTVPVDVDGRAVGPCLLYTDHRGAPWTKPLTGGRIAFAGYAPHKLAQWLRLAGGTPNPGGNDPTGHAQSLEHARPEIYAQTATLIEPVDYIGMRLTGTCATTPAAMVASWLTDNRPGGPVVYDDVLVRLARRDVARLAEMRPTGARLGPLSDAAAAEFGPSKIVPAGTAVICGVPDLHTQRSVQERSPTSPVTSRYPPRPGSRPRCRSRRPMFFDRPHRFRVCAEVPTSLPTITKRAARPCAGSAIQRSAKDRPEPSATTRSPRRQPLHQPAAAV